MSTVNDPEDREPVDDPSTEETGDRSAAREDEAPPAPSEEAAEGAVPDTSIYVRRGRTPTLGFWVAVLIALPALAALISSPFFDFPDLGAVVNFVLLAATLVGLPLAAIAAVVDAVRHRSSKTRRR